MTVDPAHMQALNQHESNNKVGEIPYFCGILTMDQLTTKQMISKINRDRNICTWNDTTKAQRLANALKGPANTWYEGLKRSHPEDWNVLKKYFLKQYVKLVTDSMLTRSLKEVRMRTNKTISK
jgi:hypothetical protein